ncbi:MAG: serine--tRNA ligase, partial [Deltaproteobacteria bacterium]
MLEIKYIRNNLSVVKKCLGARNVDIDLDALLSADEKRRTVIQELENLRHQRNTVSDEIAALKKAGKNADEKVADMRTVSARIKTLDPERIQYENEIR